MEQATQVFADYATAFEQTYADDDWSRLAPYFSEDATYEVQGGPMACLITGRDAIFAGLKKSLDGMDRRCSERRIELTEGPQVSPVERRQEVRIGWVVTYRYGDAPEVALSGRSAFTIADGMIVAMRDEYDDHELEGVGAWMQQYGAGLDGSYV